MTAAYEVLLDEGGLRCTSSDGARYLRFDAIADVSLDKDWLGRMVLVLAPRAGEAVRLPLATPTPFDLHRVVSQQIEAHGDREVRPTPAALARGGRALPAWLAEVAAGVDGGGYRGGSIDRGALADVLRDGHADVEARAAAAYALLATGDDEELVTTTSVFLEHAVPPLVLAAARAAPGGAALVDDELAAEIAPYLDEADRAMAIPGGDGDGGRIAAALARARQLLEQTPDADQGPERARGRHRLVRTGTTDADRWVGRTWAL